MSCTISGLNGVAHVGVNMMCTAAIRYFRRDDANTVGVDSTNAGVCIQLILLGTQAAFLQFHFSCCMIICHYSIMCVYLCCIYA